jgi:transcriptional regulator with XRE-family HTH domain
MDELTQAIGARVRAARVANHQTQAVVAGLTGITTDYLYQIERGKKRPGLPVLIELARVLGVPLEQLLDKPPGRPGNRLGIDDTGAKLYLALTRPIAVTEPPPILELHQRVRSAWQDWQTSPRRYSKVSSRLPLLITSVEQAARRHPVDDGQVQWRASQQCSTDLYGLLRTVAKRVGRVDLSLLVADRAMRAAENAQDPHRLAAARWNLAHVLLADQQTEGSEAVAMQAADDLAPLVQAGDLDAMAMTGALTLLGAMACARRGELWKARERVQSVAPLAARTGERNVHWTVFGPVNVAMYVVGIEIEAGEATEALRMAERIDPHRSPSIERRVAFLLDQAKGYVQRSDYGSALAVLQTVSHDAPEDVAHRPVAHQLVTTVIHRARRGVATEAARLAARAGLTIG